MQGFCVERGYTCDIKIIKSARFKVLILIVKNLQSKNKLIILKMYFYEKFTQLWCSRIRGKKT